MKKKILSTLLALTLSSSMLCSTASAITMYSPDGRTKEVPSSEIEYRKSVGWYESKTITMYSLDGRTKEVPISEIEYRKSVGWYKVPVTKVYAKDGRSQVIAKSDVDAWVKVGWYKSKSITMYSSDGRTKEVPLSEIDYRKSLGWSETPVVKSTSSTKTQSAFETLRDIIIANNDSTNNDYARTSVFFYEYNYAVTFNYHYKEKYISLLRMSLDNDSNGSLTYIYEDNSYIGYYGSYSGFAARGVTSCSSISKNCILYPEYTSENGTYISSKVKESLKSLILIEIIQSIMSLDIYLADNGYSIRVSDLGFTNLYNDLL